MNLRVCESLYNCLLKFILSRSARRNNKQKWKWSQAKNVRGQMALKSVPVTLSRTLPSPATSDLRVYT